MQCHKKLEQLAKGNSVTLLWVPGHCGIDGNEKADELARKGSETKFIGPEPVVGVPPHKARVVVGTNTLLKHNLLWDNLQTCRQSKEFIVGSNRKTTEFLLNGTRKETSLLAGILTGHCSLGKHLHTLGITASPLCRGCGEEAETAKHFLCECPTLCSVRLRCFDQRITTPENLREGNVAGILKFVKASKWFV